MVSRLCKFNIRRGDEKMKCPKCKVWFEQVGNNKGICSMCKYKMVMSGKGKEFDCI